MKKVVFLAVIVLLCQACERDFLDRSPLDTPSSETFWVSADNTKLWINNLYLALPGIEDSNIENWSDNAMSRTTDNGSVIGNGTFQSNSSIIQERWDYTFIRRCLEFLERVEEIPAISAEQKNQLSGQARFILAYEYFNLITLFRDVPLVTKTLSISESDVPKSTKEQVLNYLLDQLDKSISELPTSWPVSENGRVTKGAALALKSRVLLYNNRWKEAATAAKTLMDLNLYQLHDNFGELFLKASNNQTKEVILARQYADVVNLHDIYRRYGMLGNAGYAFVLPLPELANAFECIDGQSIFDSPLYNAQKPYENRDPRFAHTFIYPFQTINGYYYDPFDNTNTSGSLTYLHYRKYISDMKPTETHSYVNWIIFRYAEVLLNYAEAKNEESGPEESIYDALDQLRTRAGMPKVDRAKYATRDELRKLIRNERRVELAGEGLRYFDIIRWEIAESTLNKTVKSFEIPGILPVRTLETRIFDVSKHYVWPIPQLAIDRSNVLEQHSEWR